MSSFLEQSNDLTSRDQFQQQAILLKNFQNALINVNALIFQPQKAVIKLTNNDKKIKDDSSLWAYSVRGNQISIKINFQLISLLKILQKRLPDELNKQFKIFRFYLKKHQMTLQCKVNRKDNHPLINLFQKEIRHIITNINEVIQRIRYYERLHQKLQPFQDLFRMRQCFQFNRSSRPKANKISLLSKLNKNLTQIANLLAEGRTTLNKIPSIFVDKDKKRFQQYKDKIAKELQKNAKNTSQGIQLSILTAIDILQTRDEKNLVFTTHYQQALSVISTGVYEFKKQITIHKDLLLENSSGTKITDTLVRKKKTEKGKNQFQNQVKFLTYIKGSFHLNIANYYCQIQSNPFQNQSIYIQHYQESLSKIKDKLSNQKKIRILLQIARVLNFLNFRKICHRDLKLNNIMVDVNQNAKVIDWGSVCAIYTVSNNDSGRLKVHDQRLFSTQGYFQRYYEDIYHEGQMGKLYQKDQIQKGQFFDIYSFGFIIQKIFDFRDQDCNDWLSSQIKYISYKCRQKFPADRISTMQLQIYLSLIKKKFKKLNIEAITSPSSSVN